MEKPTDGGITRYQPSLKAAEDENDDDEEDWEMTLNRLFQV
jgi:hypothetical protein